MNQVMKKAVIYCRVSTKEQVDEGNSLITQEKNCRDYALKNGYEVVQIYIEQGESAKTADRTELKKLMSFCALKKNQVNAVIAYKIDRISRNTDDYSQIRILLKSHGVEIKSTSEYFENTPAGRFMENIIANVAQFDNDVRAERSVGGMKQAMSEGRYVWQAPVGFTNAKVDGKSTIIPNELAGVIKQTFEYIATQRLSVNDTRHFVVQLGICTKDGRPLAKSHFYRLLKNKVYIGEIHQFGQICKGTFPVLISENVFNAVQTIVRGKKQGKQYSIENEDFPLRRFVVNEQHKMLTGCWSQGKNQKYPYYRFSGTTKSFKKSEMENKFIALLNKFELSLENIKQFKDYVMSILKEESSNFTGINENLKLKESNLIAIKNAIIQKSIAGVLPDNFVKEELEKITLELAEIEIKIQDSKSKVLHPEFIFESLQKVLENPGLFWQSCSFEIKRKLQVFDFPSGIVFDGDNYRTPKICSIFQLRNVIVEHLSPMVNPSVRNKKHTKMSIFPSLQKGEHIALLHEVEEELTTLNQHILKPTKTTIEYRETG